MDAHTLARDSSPSVRHARSAALGVAAHDRFETVALYENRGFPSVLKNLQALGRAAQGVPGYRGPTFGARVASANPRHFSEETLREGAAAATFLCMGSYKGPAMGCVGNFS